MLLASTAGALLLLELGLRLLAPQQLLDSDTFLQPMNVSRATARSVARCLRPGVDTWHQGAEFRVRVKINSHGLRDAEIPYETPPNTRRILFLGDSMTFGYGVEADQSFAKRVQASLSGVQTIDAGCPSFGTCDELDFFRSEGIKYHPAVVVVVFFRNDVRDNVDRSTYRLVKGKLERVAREMPETAGKGDAFDATGDPFERDILNLGAAHQAAPLAGRAAEPSFLIRHSHLARLIRLRLAFLSHKVATPEQAMEQRSKAEIDLSAAIMGELVRQIRQSGAQALLVMMPQKEVVRGTTSRPPPAAEFAPIAEAAKAQGATVLDLTDALRAANRTRDPFFVKDPHPNAWGHEAAAAAIGEALRAMPRRGDT
jgi:hypothetical protein